MARWQGTHLPVQQMPRAEGLAPGLGRSPGGGNVFLPGKSHGQRSLAGYSPQGHKYLTAHTECLPPRLVRNIKYSKVCNTARL